MGGSWKKIILLALTIQFGSFCSGLGQNSIVDELKYAGDLRSPWTYTCLDGECRKRLVSSNALPSESVSVTLDVCWLTCGRYGALFPFPRQAKLTKETAAFDPWKVNVRKIKAPSKNLEEMIRTLLDEKLSLLRAFYSINNTGFGDGSGYYKDLSQSQASRRSKVELAAVELNIYVTEQTDTVTLEMDESYRLHVSQKFTDSDSNKILVSVRGVTYFGIRHGLETLSQLIAYDEINRCHRIVQNAIIQDEPSFPYRGVLIDTGRNFIPITDLKRVVDGMSYNKLNILHWHISDSNSFPFYSKSVPQMTQYGAYSTSQIYYPSDVTDLINYARLRGVKIIPELDAPAHAGNGWQWGPEKGLGELALCIDAQPFGKFCGQPPCGQLDPTNENTYLILEKLFNDMLELFDNDLFHMGGDEVSYSCWKSIYKMKSNQDIKDEAMLDLWIHFQEKSLEKLRKANKTVTPIIWSSTLTGSNVGRLSLNPKDYVVQVWETKTSYQITDLLNDGYRIIMSNVDALYADMGFGTWLGKNHNWEYKLWQTIYDNHLEEIATMHHQRITYRDSYSKNNPTVSNLMKQILGGEITLWAEKVNGNNLDAKLWPRAAALAENLWSNPKNRTSQVYSRLNYHNRRLIRRGIRSDQLQPESCLQNEGHCKNLQDYI